MPFLYIVGVNSLDKNFDITFSFLLDKQEKTYRFTIYSLRNLFRDVDRTPYYFIIDNDTTLKNALERYFPDVPQRACLQHIINNLETHILKIQGTNKALVGKKEVYKAQKEQFLGYFRIILQSKDEELFQQLYEELQERYAYVPFILEYIKEQIMPQKLKQAEYKC